VSRVDPASGWRAAGDPPPLAPRGVTFVVPVFDGVAVRGAEKAVA
jgi:hypothetical protein